MELHRNIDKRKCITCGNIFYVRSTSKHKECDIHRRDKKYVLKKCVKCGYVFTIEKHLWYIRTCEKHRIIRSGPKPGGKNKIVQCVDCGERILYYKTSRQKYCKKCKEKYIKTKTIKCKICGDELIVGKMSGKKNMFEMFI